jgi:hypothetical protein
MRLPYMAEWVGDRTGSISMRLLRGTEGLLVVATGTG